MMHHILHMLSQRTLSGPAWTRNATAEAHLSGTERGTQEFLAGISWVVSHAQLYQFFLYTANLKKMSVQAYQKSSLSFWLLCDSGVSI